MRKAPARTPHAEEGVSPVIGMILVLAISVVGIAGILYWGMPAVEEMKANVEAKSVLSQFQSLLADVQELDAGTAGKTAKRWQPTLQRGEVYIQDTTERWALAIDKREDVALDASTDVNRYNFTYDWPTAAGWEHVIRIRHGGNESTFPDPDVLDLLATSISLKAYRLEGTLATPLTIRQVTATSPSFTYHGTDGAIATDWDKNTVRAFAVFEQGGTSTPVTLSKETYRIEIWDNSKLAAEIWVFNMGEVHYKLLAGVGEKELLITNGGLIQGTNGNFALLNSPPIPPPKTTGTYRMFARMVQFDGSASIAGGDRFDILVNLYGTTGIADFECNTSTGVGCVKTVKLMPLGTMAPVWKDYYGDTSKGYAFKEAWNHIDASGAHVAGSSGTVHYLVDEQSTGMSFTAIHSILTFSG